MSSDSTLFSFTWRAALAGRTTLHTFRLARFGAMLLSPPGFPLWVRHLLWRSCSLPPLPKAGICADVYAAHLSLTSVLRKGDRLDVVGIDQDDGPGVVLQDIGERVPEHPG
jgi:hypothetical protein